ncbi:MAG: PQQ-binding-like beta-propeller repeat protein [Rhodobacteraceae bacterium]|nr:PQQ-binding-like beta-propeller repeat protein [Paracoccaceae bacterium]
MLRNFVWLLVGSVLLASCSDDEKILKGERIEVRVPLSKTVDRVSDNDAEDVLQANLLQRPNLSFPIQLPNMRNNLNWPQLNGNAAHRVSHPALSANPQRLWSVNIGAGNSAKQRITASPVIDSGLLFTMDSQTRVTAHTLNGEFVWSASLVPAFENSEDASGGGLAVAKGVLYVTTGFGELHALRAASGQQLWAQDFAAPASFPPAISDGLVFVVTQDGRAWAVESSTGRLRRSWQSVGATTSMATGSTPAIQGTTAIIPYPSGEVQAVDSNSGKIHWTATVGGARATDARSTLRSITSAPVIADDVVFVGNQAGRMVALDLATGRVLWTADEGSYSPVWLVSNSVFVVSDAGELVRLNSETGRSIWRIQLPAYKSTSLRRRKSVYANHGPLLAGGKIIVASGDRRIRFFEPVSGRLVAVIETEHGAAAPPIVVNATLFIVDDAGNLTAYR